MWQLDSAATNSASGFDFESSPPNSSAEELGSVPVPRWTSWARTSPSSPPLQETPARWIEIATSGLRSPRHSQQLPRLGDAGGAAADVFGHLSGLGDQVAVGAAHLA